MPRHHELDSTHTDPKRIKKEREKARELRKTQWWLDKINKGLCHYCGQKFKPSELTLDHVIPLARGGITNRENCVAACKKCNQDKKLDSPLDALFEQLEREKNSKS